MKENLDRDADILADLPPFIDDVVEFGFSMNLVDLLIPCVELPLVVVVEISKRITAEDEDEESHSLSKLYLFSSELHLFQINS